MIIELATANPRVIRTLAYLWHEKHPPTIELPLPAPSLTLTIRQMLIRHRLRSSETSAVITLHLLLPKEAVTADMLIPVSRWLAATLDETTDSVRIQGVATRIATGVLRHTLLEEGRAAQAARH